MQIWIKQNLWVILAASASFIFLSILTFSSGIRADDAGFIYFYETSSFVDWFSQSINYVPGRNLHTIWQNFFYFLSGLGSFNPMTYHLLQSLFATINGLLIGTLLSKVGVSRGLSMSAVVLSIFWPSHFEALVWPSALPMHVLTGTFLLLMCHSLYSFFNSGARQHLIICITAFLLSAFTYDQGMSTGFYLAAFLFVSILRNKKGEPNTSKNIWYISITLFLVAVIYTFLFIQIRPLTSGPTAGDGILFRLINQVSVFIDSGGITGTNLFIETGIAGAQAIIFNLRLILLISITLLIVGLLRVKKQSSILKFDKFSRYHSRLSLFSIGAVVSASIPAWAWYVSPRHNYIPDLFLVMAVTLSLSSLMKQFPSLARLPLLIAPALLLSFACLIALQSSSKQALDWASIEKVRTNTYSKIVDLVPAYEQPTCVYFPQVDPAGPGPFYSEFVASAFSIYSSKAQSKMPRCFREYPGRFDAQKQCFIDSSNLRPNEQIPIIFPKVGDQFDWEKPSIGMACQ